MKPDPETLNAIAALITALATVMLVIATVLLASATRRLNQISDDLKSTQHSAAITQALNILNFVVLNSDDNLKIAEALVAQPGDDQSIAKIRERWICFLILNVQALIFATRHKDKSFEELWAAAQTGVLDHLLRNDSVMHLLRTRGYTADFIKYCEERRKTLLQSTAV